MGKEMKSPSPASGRERTSLSHTGSASSNNGHQEGASVHDGPDRTRAEQALAHSEKRFRSLVQNTSDIITLVDASGKITYETPAVERVFGYKPEERVGSNALSVVHPDDLDAVQETFQRALRGAAQSNVVEFRGRHKSGGWRNLELTITNLLHDPAVEGMVMNTRDITDRRQTERALQNSEQKLLLHFQQTLLGVIEWDTNCEFL
jgi:PAS domain S-box-containing protein